MLVLVVLLSSLLLPCWYYYRCCCRCFLFVANAVAATVAVLVVVVVVTAAAVTADDVAIIIAAIVVIATALLFPIPHTLIATPNPAVTKPHDNDPLRLHKQTINRTNEKSGAVFHSYHLHLVGEEVELQSRDKGVASAVLRLTGARQRIQG